MSGLIFSGPLRLGLLTSDPDSPQMGTIYFNTSVNAARFYTGTEWITIDSLPGQVIGLDANSENSEGVASSLARSDHTHAIETSEPTSQVPGQENQEGVSAGLARADHKHEIPTASAVTIDATTSNSEGNAASFARSNHTHQILSAAATTQSLDQSNAIGSSTSFARADHIHNIPTASPLDTGLANQQGSAATFARSDHIHNTILQSYCVRQNSSTTTNSTNNNGVSLAGMSITPVAGTYLISGYAQCRNNGAGNTISFSIYVAGTQDSDTLQGVVQGAGGLLAALPTHTWGGSTMATLNGSQSIEIRWYVSGGTGTVWGRHLNAIRIG